MRRLTDAALVRAFMRELGRAAKSPATVYLTGGATAVLEGWRSTTIDVDIKVLPDSDEVLRAIPRLKEQLEVNVELAAPDQFLPPLPGWRERSAFIAKEGALEFRHYDFYAQALAKLERGHRQDLEDVVQLKALGRIEPERLLELLGSIEPELFRYPAVDPTSLRRAVEGFVRRP